jgi:quercetin dioxygenase-like cupin family protein
MADHARVNLLEVPDAVAGRAEGIEGHFGRGPVGARDIGVSLWRYAPGFRATAGHRHREQEEAYLVVSGSGEILLDGEVGELRQWDLVRVSPGVVRAFAAGPEGLEIVAVGGPKPEGGDGEQMPVTWPGAGG